MLLRLGGLMPPRASPFSRSARADGFERRAAGARGVGQREHDVGDLARSTALSACGSSMRHVEIAPAPSNGRYRSSSNRRWKRPGSASGLLVATACIGAGLTRNRESSASADCA